MKRKHVGFLEVVCEAPSYNLISACTWLERPLDQRWQWHTPAARAICCGLWVPMPQFRFTYTNGAEEVIGVGQCPVCKACHWHA